MRRSGSAQQLWESFMGTWRKGNLRGTFVLGIVWCCIRPWSTRVSSFKASILTKMPFWNFEMGGTLTLFPFAWLGAKMARQIGGPFSRHMTNWASNGPSACGARFLLFLALSSVLTRARLDLLIIRVSWFDQFQFTGLNCPILSTKNKNSITLTNE